MLDGEGEPPAAPPPLTLAEVEAQRVQIESDHQAALAAIRAAVLSDWDTLNQTLETGYETRANELETTLAESAARLDTVFQATDAATQQRGAQLLVSTTTNSSPPLIAIRTSRPTTPRSMTPCRRDRRRGRPSTRPLLAL